MSDLNVLLIRSSNGCISEVVLSSLRALESATVGRTIM